MQPSYYANDEVPYPFTGQLMECGNCGALKEMPHETFNQNMENVGAAHELPGVTGSKIRDEFRGDDELLKRCIVSLISLNDSGSLAPHGIGGHARSLLSAAYHSL